MGLWLACILCVYCAFAGTVRFVLKGFFRTSSSAGHASSGLCLGPPMNKNDNGKRSSLGPNLLAKLIQLGDKNSTENPHRKFGVSGRHFSDDS